MKKTYAIMSGMIVTASLMIVQAVYASERQPAPDPTDRQPVPISIAQDDSMSKLQISTPSYPIGMRGGETRLIPYRLIGGHQASGEIVSRTLQFYTQYGVPLSDPMGPYPTRIDIHSSRSTDWNEPVFLPKSVFEKARAMDEYAIVLKTTFEGKSQVGETFSAQSSLLLLFPPAPFGKVTPDHQATHLPVHPFLNWGSSVGAVDYEYCFDTVDNNSCDTNWTGTYWVGTYESKATPQNLPYGATIYWQVRANNMAGTTYANHGRWWSFTTCNASLLMVTNTNDSGSGSLRQAIADICAGGTIKIDPSLAGQTISLATDLLIDKDLTIDGSSLSPQVTISGENKGHILIQNPINAPTVTLTDLTIANGYSSGTGGAIFSNAVLTIINSTIRDSYAAGDGGAIYSARPLTLKHSTLFQNKAGSDGGALALVGTAGGTTITNSTVTHNQAVSTAGGISMIGNTYAEMINSTFAGNDALAGKEIMLNGNTTLNLYNTIFACAGLYDECYRGLFINPANSTLGLGTPADFGLGNLTDNGGPTQTMALLLGSSAINAGDDATCPTADQRGIARPYGSHCDLGAYEYQKNIGGDTTGVFRPSNGLLYLKNSNDTGFADMALNYGLPGDYPVVGDWDGNGTVTIGVYRKGTFYLRNSNTIGFADVVFSFGTAGDQPIAGDWNGDGIDTIGVYRPSIGQFLLRNSNSEGGAETSFFLGNRGDVGIAGDWNGDGRDTTGVFRPSNGIIFLKDANNTGFADYALNYGLPGDKPVMGDWDNDGIDTIAVYRNGTFYLRNENTNGFATIVFDLGNPGDIPIAGDWDALP